MNMWVVCQCLAPGVQDGHSTCLRTKKIRVYGTLHQSLPGSLEKQPTGFVLVQIEKRMQTCRNGENHMKMFYRRQVSCQFIYPLDRFYKLALRTISVPAGVISLPCMIASVATVNMATKCSGAAPHDGIKSFLLFGAKLVMPQECFCMATENISKLNALAFVIHRSVS
jgi:hypothetical protein